MNLTDRETEVLNFIRNYIRDNGRSPYQQEIADQLEWASRGFIYRIIRSLESKGAVSTMRHVPGSITIRDEAPQSPIDVSLRNDVRSALELIAKAEGTKTSVIIAEWVSERVAFELRSRTRAA